jgi:hypothetical protein
MQPDSHGAGQQSFLPLLGLSWQHCSRVRWDDAPSVQLKEDQSSNRYQHPVVHGALVDLHFKDYKNLQALSISGGRVYWHSIL